MGLSSVLLETYPSPGLQEVPDRSLDRFLPLALLGGLGLRLAVPQAAHCIVPTTTPLGVGCHGSHASVAVKEIEPCPFGNMKEVEGK